MKSMGISFAAHRYAPELFKQLMVYKRPFHLKSDKLRELGYIFMTKGSAACFDEIKRLYRASLRNRRRCTIGFMLKDSKCEYCYTRCLTAPDDSLPAKLSIYKEFKQHLLERGGQYECGETASLGAGYRVESVEKRYETADLSRPLKIYFLEGEAKT